MKVFSCRCGSLTHFENVACVTCGAALAFLPEELDLAVVTPDGDRLRADRGPSEARYRLCKNATDYGACNWLVSGDDPRPFCLSCRLNQIVPPLCDDGARAAWIKIESAKRRLVYSLLDLGLRPRSKADDPAHGLGFVFLAELDPNDKVLTGHADGVITLNIAEADDPFREGVRESLGETYRTLLGHLRHEVGHYSWDLFFKDNDQARARFRSIFGDESQDYGSALEKHYREGPPADWPRRFVSAYASSHPWEDWAESWAHYLHLRDTTETARAFGLAVVAQDARGRTHPEASSKPSDGRSFERLIEAFPPLTLAINSLNRSMGVRDAYPFVWSDGAIAKMRFVHECTRDKGDRT